MTSPSKPDLAEVLEHYGADLSAIPSGSDWESVNCPFHNDHTASARISLYRQRFRCFTGDCGISGDSIQLIREAEGLGFKDALQYASDNFGHGSSGLREAARGHGERYRPFGEEEGY